MKIRGILRFAAIIGAAALGTASVSAQNWPLPADPYLFVQSEGPDTVGRGQQFRVDGSQHNFSVLPVLEGFGTLLNDASVRVRVVGPQNQWRLFFANRDVLTLRVGSDRLACLTDASRSNQCVSYYAAGIVPTDNSRSIAAGAIRRIENGVSRSCDGTAAPWTRFNDFSSGAELVRFNVADIFYAATSRPITGTVSPQTVSFTFTRPNTMATFPVAPPEPGISATNALFRDGEIAQYISHWGFSFSDFVTLQRVLTTVYDTGDAATALSVTYTYAWEVATRRSGTDIVGLSIDFEQACSFSGDFGRLFGSLRLNGGASIPYVYGSAKIRGYSIPQLGSDVYASQLTVPLPDNTQVALPTEEQLNFRRRFPAHTRDYLLYFENGNSQLGVGPGLLTTADVDFSAEPLYGDILKGVRVIARGPGNNIVMDFGSAFDQPAHTNCRGRVCFNYTNLQRRISKDDINAGINLTVNGRSCERISGSMVVREAYFNGNRVDAFAADFDITCDGSASFRGELRFNSDIAVGDYDEDGIPDVQEASSNRARNEPDNYLLTANTIDSTGLFVRQQYRDFYASEASISAYTRDLLEIDLGARTRSQFLNQLFVSSQFYDLHAPVARLYLASFGRLSDSTGLNYWVNRYKSLRRPTTLTGIAEFYVNSAEFRLRFPALVDPAANRAFVRQLYVNVLGRTPDQAGEDFWTDRLATGAITRAQLVVQFSESVEHVQRTRDNININLAYFAMLRRDPSAIEYASYADLLSGRRLLPNGQQLTVSAMLDFIARSEEYCERFTEIQYCRSVTAP
jgi:Domain of unknown function (DUF4214)